MGGLGGDDAAARPLDAARGSCSVPLVCSCRPVKIHVQLHSDRRASTNTYDTQDATQYSIYSIATLQHRKSGAYSVLWCR